MQKYVLKKFIKIKLLSSSIMEVIVALTICMIIFSISMTLIMNLQKNNNIHLKQEAQLLLSTLVENFNGNDSIVANNKFILKTHLQKIDTIPGLYKLNFAVHNKANQKLATKTIWINSENMPELTKRNFNILE